MRPTEIPPRVPSGRGRGALRPCHERNDNLTKLIDKPYKSRTFVHRETPIYLCDFYGFYLLGSTVLIIK